MLRFNLYVVRGSWDVSTGTLISTHKTKKAVMSRMVKEANKLVPKVYYYQHTQVSDKLEIIDFGSYTKFLAIEEVDDENA